jgi:hypothetical protein
VALGQSRRLEAALIQSVAARDNQIPVDGDILDTPLGGRCPVRMSSWYVFLSDTCPRAMSTLSKARYYKGLDKRTCPFHLSNMSVSVIEQGVRALLNQRLDNTYLSKP